MVVDGLRSGMFPTRFSIEVTHLSGRCTCELGVSVPTRVWS